MLGPTGPTGPAFAPSMGYFGYTSSAPTTITGGDSIAFNQEGSIHGLTVTGTPITEVGIQNSGDYRLAYGALYSSASSSELRIQVNGVDLAIGHLNVVVETNGEVSMEVIVPLSAGDVISLVVAGTSITLTTIGTSAYLSIMQLA